MKKKKISKKTLLIFILLIAIGTTIAYFSNIAIFENLFITKALPTLKTEEVFTSPDGWKPGDTTPKTITTTNVDSDENICIRVKFEEKWMSVNNNELPLYQNGNRAAIINMSNQDKWLEAADSWYYYQVELAKGETSVSPIESVTFNPLIEGDVKCTTTTDNGETTKTCTSTGDGYDGATYTLTITTEGIECKHVDDYWKPEYLLTSYVTSLFYKGDTTLANDDPDQNIRYIGSNPDNYVQFNGDELWRMIGVFEADNGTGLREKRIKLIRDDSIGSYSWDTSDSSINCGNGINEWSQAALMKILNPGYESESVGGSLYYTKGTGNCYNNRLKGTIECDFSNTGLVEEAKTLIEDAVWNLGSPNNNNGTYDDAKTASDVYSRERSINIGKICTSGCCTDTVTRTTSWTGLVGLIYPSDYFYATSDGTTTSRTTCLNSSIGSWLSNSNCDSNDWLASTQWTISPSAYVSGGQNVLSMTTGATYNGVWPDHNACFPTNVRPVVYLKSSVKIMDGEGTSEKPYQISL